MTDATSLDYSNRASNCADPRNWLLRLVESTFTKRPNHQKLAALASTGTTFHADISEFQAYYDTSYPYPQIAIRGDNGSRLDYHFIENHKRIQADPKIKVEVIYVVYRQGQSGAIVARLKSALGPRCPNKVVFRIDMESGSDFAGPGNHSAEADQLLSALNAYAGNSSRSDGYANHYDWIENWPQHPSGLKQITANYGTNNPGTYGWQYYGGLSYPTPAGYPRSCPPFGQWVDLNVTHRSIDQIMQDYGLATPPPPPKPIPVVSGPDRLVTGEALNEGHSITSQNKVYRLVMQSDGNCVIYHNSKPIWQTRVRGNYLKLQSDANVVLYTSKGKAMWQSRTNNTQGQILIMQNDGNLVLYTAGGRAVWQTYTYGK